MRRRQLSKIQTTSLARRFNVVIPSFIPTSITGCQLWLDGSDTNSITLSGSNVTQWRDKSGNGYHMNILAGSSSIYWSGTPEYPIIGTSINEKTTLRFSPQAGLKQSTTLDGVKNFFWVGRIAAPTGSGIAANYFLLGHDTSYDWAGTDYNSIDNRILNLDYAAVGIKNASPTSLFTTDANAITNTAFQNVFKPTAPNVSLLSAAGITGSTKYQGVCYDRDAHIGWCGDLAEVITFSTDLTTTNREKVEGYLAHKWGLQSTLPANHPYKTTAPSG